MGKFTVRSGDVAIGVMEPSKRSFSARAMSTNEAALMTRGAGQLYLSLGDSNNDGSFAVRFYYKPMVLLIWLGAVLMMLGGALSLSDRRLRIGRQSRQQNRTGTGRVGGMRSLARLTLLVALIASGAALAVQPDEILKDPALEARARDLSRELRCMAARTSRSMIRGPACPRSPRPRA